MPPWSNARGESATGKRAWCNMWPMWWADTWLSVVPRNTWNSHSLFVPQGDTFGTHFRGVFLLNQYRWSHTSSWPLPAFPLVPLSPNNPSPKDTRPNFQPCRHIWCPKELPHGWDSPSPSPGWEAYFWPQLSQLPWSSPRLQRPRVPQIPHHVGTSVLL